MLQTNSPPTVLQLESPHGVTAGIPPRCYSWNPATVLQLESPRGVTAGIPPRCYSWNPPTVLQLESPHGVTAEFPPRRYSWNPPSVLQLESQTFTSKNLRHATPFRQPAGTHSLLLPARIRRKARSNRRGCSCPAPPSTDRLGPEPTQKNHLPFALFPQNAAKSAGRNYPRSLASHWSRRFTHLVTEIQHLVTER